MKTVIVILNLMLFCCYGQNTVSDSLYNLLAKTKNDTSKINLYNALAFENCNNNPDTAIFFAKKAIKLSKEHPFNVGLAESYLAIGKTYVNLGEGDSCLVYLNKALQILSNEKTSYRVKKDLGGLYNSIGNTHISKGEYSLAISNYKKSLAYRTEIKETSGIIVSYNNIGNIHYALGDFKQALENYFKALNMAEKNNDDKSIALASNNIGSLSRDLQKPEEAILYYNKAIAYAKKKNILYIIANVTYNLSEVYLEQKQYNKALKSATEAYEIGKKINNVANISNALSTIGQVYLKEKNYTLALQKEFEALAIAEKADNPAITAGVLNILSQIYNQLGDCEKVILYAEKSVKISQKTGAITNIPTAGLLLANCYAKLGNYKKAYEMEKLTLQINDSVVNQKNKENLMGESFKYQYEKQSLSDSLKYDAYEKINNFKTQETLKTERYKRWGLSTGLAVAIVLGLLFLNRYRITQKQKSTIEKQNNALEKTHHSLEEKTKIIEDSILYSKEIQNIFLKSLVNDNRFFNDALLIYKPKDVVSGDFYWYKEINDNLYIVVGDCTGHGVPGAIISVLAIQSLEKVIYQVQHNEELHYLNELMRKEFDLYYDKDRHVSIGLDYSIVCVNKKEEKLYLSGSGGSLFLKDTNNQMRLERFESINIGGVVPVVYNPETKIHAFKEIRSLFLFTDGVTDQRGGTNNKKFGSKNLKELLMNLNTKNTQETLVKIETSLDAWKGNNTQMDDITFLGLQINA